MAKKLPNAWFRGDTCHLMPPPPKDPTVHWLLKNVGYGWLPKNRFITKKSKITAIGSCFARNIVDYLRVRGYQVNPWRANLTLFNAGVFNTYTLLQQFQWAYDGLDGIENWFPSLTERADTTEKARLEMRNIFDNSNVLILTLGLSEVWYDKKTGFVFWRAAPKPHYNPKKHAFRTVTFSENKENILKVINFAKTRCKKKPKIIFSLSPVKLRATFRDISTITANSVSKASLRASLDEALTLHPDVYYWPAYEMARIHKDAYQDAMHPKAIVTKKILSAFSRAYLR
jgi:hypothetical protein